MIDLENEYPGQVEAADANYPTGGFKNETTPGLFNGTPFEKAWANDLNAFMQGLVTAAGITPSGSADTVPVSQLLQGLLHQVAAGAYFEDTGAADVYVIDAFTGHYNFEAYKTGMLVRFVPDNTNMGASTVDVSGLGVKNIKKEGSLDPEAGDLLAGGTVVLEYDGTNFQLVSVTPLRETNVRDLTRGLIVKNNAGNPLFQVDIDADEIVLQTASGTSFRASGVNETADITVTGAGGLDVVAEAADTWYYLWIIAKADGTVSSLLSLSSTAPTMPADYIYKALVGVVRNNSGSNFVLFEQRGGRVDIEEQIIVKDGAFTANAWTAQSMTAFYPPTAKRIRSAVACDSLRMGLSPRSDGFAGEYFRFNDAGGTANFGTVFPTDRDNYVSVEIRYEDTVYYFVGAVGSTILATGWEF